MSESVLTAESADISKDCLAKQLADLRLEYDDLKAANNELKILIDELRGQIAWFQKEVFGPKSEKRHITPPEQQSLLGDPVKTDPEPSDQQTVSYQRGKAKKQRPEDCATDTGLRFTDDVPVEIITVTPPELVGPQADQYEVLDTQIRHKLA